MAPRLRRGPDRVEADRLCRSASTRVRRAPMPASLPRLGLILFTALAASLAAAGPERSGDWPQWQGPDRNGVSRETGLLKSWPSGGPKLVWKATGLGGGFTAP